MCKTVVSSRSSLVCSSSVAASESATDFLSLLLRLPQPPSPVLFPGLSFSDSPILSRLLDYTESALSAWSFQCHVLCLYHRILTIWFGLFRGFDHSSKLNYVAILYILLSAPSFTNITLLITIVTQRQSGWRREWGNKRETLSVSLCTHVPKKWSGPGVLGAAR